MSTAPYDLAYVSELKAAADARPSAVTTLFLLSIAALLAAGVAWSLYAHVDEVAVGNGRVIPSRQVQVVQNLEGGILSDLLVKEGQVVEQGQVLLRVDDTGFQADLRQNQSKRVTLEAQIARLTAEVGGHDVVFPERLAAEAPAVVASERALFTSRMNELAAALQALGEQVDQKRKDVANLQTRDQTLSRSLAFLRNELGISQQLAEKGYRSKLEVLRLERQHSDLEGQLLVTRNSIPQAQSALAEAERKLEERRLSHRSQALAELNQRQAELAALSEVLRAQEDRVTRREVRSPVRGLIKQTKVHTIGGVIQPGADLMEIVPLDDRLVIEARVSPNDIAFIHPGQKAMVKLTAYDYSVYGGLEAELEHISGDSLFNERGEPYYLIRVVTKRNYLGTEANKLTVIPGMVATVDIVTGEKTVFHYLMKPILKTTERAMRER